MPDEPPYAEIGRVDPDGRGHASYELAPASPLRLSPRLIRVTADNGSMMTGPGTNCYLIGGGEQQRMGRARPRAHRRDAHVQAILDAAPGPIRWIFVTHTHKDHSPAAQALKARTGAQLLGMAALHAEWQDTDFVPDVPLRGGERFDLPGDSTLHVIHTPGHAGNHLCYLLERGAAAVHRRPRDAGLHRRHQPARRRHGRVPAVAARADGTRAGLAGPRPRLPDAAAAPRDAADRRPPPEARGQGAEGLRAPAPPQPMDQLLAAVYDDVPPKLHAMARRSLQAHLLKLRDDGRIVESPPGHWALHGA